MGTTVDFDFEYIQSLKEGNPAWKLLASDHAPFIISFFFQTFIKENQRSLSYSYLHMQLENYLLSLRHVYKDKAPARSAKEYIEIWSSSPSIYLHQRYEKGSDDPILDLTPSVEKVISWVRNLEGRSFIGTESRLLNLFNLMEQFVQGTQTDSEEVLKKLYEQRDKIDQEIAAAQKGEVKLLTETQVRERTYQLIDESQALLSDFRQIEENFRGLDRNIRQKIMTADHEKKGKVLEDVFDQYDSIERSDQGQSFKAFWEFLIQAPKQEEFEFFIQHILKLDELQGLKEKRFLGRFKDYLVEAGAKVYRTNNVLTEQLRRFIVDNVKLDNRRIIELIKKIENKVLKFDDLPTQKKFFEMPSLKSDTSLQLQRPLFYPEKEVSLREGNISIGDLSSDQLENLDILYSQVFIDEERLINQVNQLLLKSSQVLLSEVVDYFPLEEGLTELLYYFKLANENKKVRSLIQEDNDEVIIFHPTIGERKVEFPKVVFLRLSQ